MTAAEQPPAASRGRQAMVRVDEIDFHPRNIRRDLGDLRELTASIREFGVLEPLLLEDRGSRGRPLAGHRRLAAARMAGLRRVPCLIVPEHADEDAIVVMVSENRHRVGLTPDEKTSAARALAHEFGWTQARIAQRLGVHPQTVGRWLAGRDEHEPTVVEEQQASARGRKAAATRSATRAPGQHKRVVSVSAVRGFVEQWEGRVPRRFLDELRELCGDAS